MERNSLSNKFLKNHDNNGMALNKDCSSINSQGGGGGGGGGEGGDLLCGFSWPPRSYICSFCKREFRSAQALGGHMNVHRRDRARLRQYSPPVDGKYSLLNLNLDPNPNLKPNPNPNPNPNFSSSSSASTLTPSSPPRKFQTFFASEIPPPLVSPSLPSSHQSWPSSSSIVPGGGGGEIKKWTQQLAEFSVTKAATTKALFCVREQPDNFTHEKDLNVKAAEIVKLDLEIGLISDPKEDLDLELRLGYSS